MQDLPSGWRVSNSSGSWSAPAYDDERFGDDDRDDDTPNDGDLGPDSPGWEDMEDDTETLSIKCLLCPDLFASAQAMLDHCKAEHQFDLEQIHLDYYATIKLVNYVRAEVRSGAASPDTSDRASWADDKYMKPTLEDDALLFNLDELLSMDERDAEGGEVREYLDPQTEGVGQKVLAARALR